MYWYDAKKAVIILLVLLNAVLFGLNYRESRMFYVSAAREKAIFDILSQNNISLYSFIDKYKPMRNVSVTPIMLKRDDIDRIFFKEEETKITYEFDRTVIKGSNLLAKFKENRVNLEFEQAQGEAQEIREADAQIVAREFVNSYAGEMNRFSLGQTLQTDSGYIFEYYEKYKGFPIYCSSYRVFVTAQGVKSADISFFTINGYEGFKKEICGVDEALMTFLSVMRHAPQSKPIVIEKVEQGYDFQHNVTLDEKERTKLVPCYRIFILGEQEPLVINAYTNELIEIKVEAW